MNGLKDSTQMMNHPALPTDALKNEPNPETSNKTTKGLAHELAEPSAKREDRYFTYSYGAYTDSQTGSLVRLTNGNWEPIADIIGDVQRFHEKFGLKYDGKPRALTGELRHFRVGFIEEEYTEYRDSSDQLDEFLDDLNHGLEPDDAYTTEQLELQLDALLDLAYVTIGAALLQFPEHVVREGWDRVQRANMSKERAAPDGSNSKRNTGFDVIKPPGWMPPSHTDLVEDLAHRSE